MEFWGCVKWSGVATYLQSVFLCLLAGSGVVGGIIVVTIPWRPGSALSKLPTSQALWIGVMMIAAGLGMLSLVIPPMFGFNRCQ
jgi:hypothetical protein